MIFSVMRRTRKSAPVYPEEPDFMEILPYKFYLSYFTLFRLIFQALFKKKLKNLYVNKVFC